jgi:predicted  nucleic acid-binding Zn-ribbon protein
VAEKTRRSIEELQAHLRAEIERLENKQKAREQRLREDLAKAEANLAKAEARVAELKAQLAIQPADQAA